MAHKKRKRGLKSRGGAAALAGATAALLSTSKAHAFGAGGSDGAGCGNDGNSGNDASPSCPFLSAWVGDRFAFENDFLHGKPSSLFPSREAGWRSYSEHRGGDILKLSLVDPETRELRLQIREIEPEESFIDSVSVERIFHPANTSVIVDGGLDGAHVIDDQSIDWRAGVSRQSLETKTGTSVDWLVAATPNASRRFLELDTGDYVNLEATLDTRFVDDAKPLFLCLNSSHRDWMASSLLRDEVRTLLMSGDTSRPRSRRTAIATAAIAGAIGAGLLGANDPLSPDRLHALSDGMIPTAHADNPSGKSLVVRYWSGKDWVHVETVTPRFLRSTTALVRIPIGAADGTGRVRLQIEATRRHHVTGCFLFRSNPKSNDVERETFTPSQAWHHREGQDHAMLLSRRNRTFMRTIPGDVVDLAFELPPVSMSKDRRVTLLFRSHGFYTPATDAGRRKAGDWVRRLDPSSRAVLRELYLAGTRSRAA